MKNLQTHIDYWLISAGRDWNTARSLFNLKRYDMCLFFCHLAIEKLLKGLVTHQTKTPAPYIHNLPRLAVLAGLSLTPEQTTQLKEITTFHIAGRYDNEKFNFYKRCTRQFTQKQFETCSQCYLWLKKQYPKKS